MTVSIYHLMNMHTGLAGAHQDSFLIWEFSTGLAKREGASLRSGSLSRPTSLHPSLPFSILFSFLFSPPFLSFPSPFPFLPCTFFLSPPPPPSLFGIAEAALELRSPCLRHAGITRMHHHTWVIIPPPFFFFCLASPTQGPKDLVHIPMVHPGLS